MHNKNKQIAVTGLGAISSTGTGREGFWNAVINGESGVGPISFTDTSDCKIHIAAEIKDFSSQTSFGKEGSSFGKHEALAIAGTQLALDDAGLELHSFDPFRIGVIVGNLVSETTHLEMMASNNDPKNQNDASLARYYPYPYVNISYAISNAFDLCGPSETIYCACSSGNVAIARSCELIRQGDIDIAIAGGVDIMNLGVFMLFQKLKLLAPDKCRPFDKNRNGTVIGEGAGLLILEDYEQAVAKKRHIYAEILGCGLSCDAYHPSSPHPAGEGIVSAMKMALSDARIKPEDVDYISAHGTGTKLNDAVETQAIKDVFSNHSNNLFISSIKSMIGHTMGASSALQAITCCLAITEGIVPPTINYHDLDPDCDLNVVPNKSIKYPVHICMNNSLGFGGINASVIFKGI